MNRSVGIALGGIAITAVLLVVLSYLGSGQGSVDLILLEFSGDITVRGSDNAATPPEAGQTLRSRDTVQTGAGGRAVVSIGGDGRLDIGPRTEVQITSIDGNDVEVELFGGRMSARVMPDSRAVRIARDQRAVIATNADVDVAVDGDGDLFVEVQRGEAAIEGIPGASMVGEGERLATRNGRTAEIGPVPSSLLLTVQWPEGTRVRRPGFPVRGTTRPAIPVVIRGASGDIILESDADGGFSVDVELTEGDNTLVITAEDPLGESTSSEHIIRLDSTGPAFSGDVEYPR